MLKKTLSKIHARFRQLRSGEVADILKMQGIEYRLAWGLESYRLKTIAEEVKAEINDEQFLKELAETLLAENVRESMMIATRLYPANLLSKEKAESWADGIRYTEQADQACMNLFSKAAFATELVDEWINSEGIKLYMALQLASRLDIDNTKIRNKAKQTAEDATLPMWLRSMANNLQ